MTLKRYGRFAPLLVSTIPEATDCSGLNGDAALGFLFHEIGGGLTIVNFTDFVNFTSESLRIRSVVVVLQRPRGRRYRCFYREKGLTLL